MFGGAGAADLAARLVRERGVYFLVALAAPLLPAMSRRPKVLAAAVPTLLLVILLQESDYLNIKYWHQSSILPVLFLAATLGVTRRSEDGASNVCSRGGCLGAAIALLVGVLTFHQLSGNTPLAVSYHVASRRSTASHDVRADVVAHVRSMYSRGETVVTATQRMAAHFIDYRMVYTVGDVDPTPLGPERHVLIIDRSDRWDPTIQSGEAEAVVGSALAAGFAPALEAGPVIVLDRAANIPVGH
jgi:hypothetical protein